MTVSKVRTAIFPVAGLGTRFLPATKGTPKELLPVIDTPLIQFAIDEARAAGIERMVFVNHPSKSAIERYVRDDADLRATLTARGKTKEAALLAQLAAGREDEIVFVDQPEPLGLGHAVACAREAALPGPVAVILPDDLILGGQGCIGEMVDAYRDAGVGHLIAVMDVARDEVSSYGVLDVIERRGPLSRARAMVEKPAPEDAPSRTAVVGRYVLDASIFDDLATQAPGAGGEIQLTDAIAAAAPRIGLAGLHFSGDRYDCGSKAGMLAASLRLAAEMGGFDEVLDDFARDRRPASAVRFAAE